ncbi:hypothetical protein WN55_08022 [Dufourea novaeangliae]|uniref:Uncharacterized protein n=1 Tax=Dufourea novaeangliae TaxID=178035 RepID=A0A154P758_DUFNO|nr:hypothetical protein WN55_08022 [Dufourea novaeangliae]
MQATQILPPLSRACERFEIRACDVYPATNSPDLNEIDELILLNTSGFRDLSEKVGSCAVFIY